MTVRSLPFDHIALMGRKCLTTKWLPLRFSPACPCLLQLKSPKSFLWLPNSFMRPTIDGEAYSIPPSYDEDYSFFSFFFVSYTRELLILFAQNVAPKRKRQADSTDFISSALTRRFGLAGGLAWLGILSFGVISEQVKTRREVFEAEQNTKYVSLLLAFRATAL
jgi:hypothetical protein